VQSIQALVDKQRDDQLTLEHYTERYVPVQVQNMIMDNLRLIHDDTVLAKLTEEETGLCVRLHDELLDESNPARGTIFDNIQRTNAEMTAKMQVRIDLRTLSAVEDGESPEASATDRHQALERKIDKHIDAFLRLNRENGLILEK